MKLFKSKKRKDRDLDSLKNSAKILDMVSAIGHVDMADMAYVALISGIKAAKDLGFNSLSEARKYYNI